jgi:cation:H+ antiporter
MKIYLLTVIGFVLVVKGADLLVDGASALARRLNVSDFAIGLTVIAFGTSLPELSVNIAASLKGTVGITIGNIIGSNTANILLILGISGVIFPLSVTKGTVWKGIPFGLLAAVLVAVMANDRLIDGNNHSVIGRIDGLVLLSFFIIFVYYSVGNARMSEESSRFLSERRSKASSSIALMAGGLAALIVGSKFVVDGAVGLARVFAVSESLVGLTIVAVGTSLPELATSAVAAYKKNPEIAVGNIIGSNIFNIFFILGLSSVIRPLPFGAEYNFDIAVLILASMLLFLFMFTGQRRRLDRWEAILFVCLYIAYIWVIVRDS